MGSPASLEKVFVGARLTDAEGLHLYTVKDLSALGYLANIVRERKNGNAATYIPESPISNYSNVCILNCQFLRLCAAAA